MDFITLINTAVGITSLVVSFFFGGFAIWLSMHFYTKAKDTEREVSNSLEELWPDFGDGLKDQAAAWS